MGTKTDALESEPDFTRLQSAIQGCLFGTAVADAIGLPYEGMSAGRIRRFKAVPLRHRFLFGIGMMSDDTEHSCMVAQSLIASRGDIDCFSRVLAWRMRWWFIGLPAGIGLATLRACLKLWIGFPAKYSGVYSAGNGPAMRSAILGVVAAADMNYCKQLVSANTRITHTDPRALKGAMIVAELAALNSLATPLTPGNCMEYLAVVIGDDEELKGCITHAINSAANNQSALEYCQQAGMSDGVSGYIYQTLPVVLQIVLRYPDDYEQAITEAICCGGDTDTVAAIVGGIVGSGTGVNGIPASWLKGFKDWPRTKSWIHKLGNELNRSVTIKKVSAIPRVDLIRVWIRNLPFMVWVLAHGFRRLLPPYV